MNHLIIDPAVSTLCSWMLPELKVLEAQDDLVSSMKEASAKELLLVSPDQHVNKKLLNGLIVQ